VSYAFGLMKLGKDCFWHDGVFQGIRNITILYPEQNVGLVLLSNSGSNDIMRSAFSVAEMFVKDSVPREQITSYKKKFSDKPTKNADNPKIVYFQNLDDFKGIFLNTELLITYRIIEQEDSLFAENSLERILLTPIEGESDKFNSSKLLLGDFVFKRNENGQVTELYIKQKRDNIIRFKKLNTIK
jgi:hypothetical protein